MVPRPAAAPAAGTAGYVLVRLELIDDASTIVLRASDPRLTRTVLYEP